jgi:HK97 family phage major capsid protein
MLSDERHLQYLIPGISSGYQKSSYEELKSVTFDLQDKIAEAAANSDARYLENAVLNGTATVTSKTVTGFQGVVAAATNALGGSTTIAAGALTDNTFEDILAQIPVVYRKRIRWVTSRSGMSLLRKQLKDADGRPLYKTLLEYSEENDPDLRTFKGQPIYESEWMPAATTGNKFLVGFVSDMYQIRAFADKRFDFLREKFHPLLAWTSIGYWAGCYLGPAGTAFYVQLT